MLDPRIELIRKQYDLRQDDFWKLPQGRDVWLVKHAALEVIAAKAGIEFDAPQILEADGGNGVAAICVRGTYKDRSMWSIGEASPKNCKNAYPWAIAEKRAVDRVVLKLVGIHGLVYSEDEADDFKQDARSFPARLEDGRSEMVSTAPKRQVGWSKDGTTRTAHSLKKEKVWEEFQMELLECETPGMVTKLALAWSKKVEDDSWPESWKELLREEMKKRMDLLKSKPAPDDDSFPGDRPSGRFVSTLEAG